MQRMSTTSDQQDNAAFVRTYTRRRVSDQAYARMAHLVHAARGEYAMDDAVWRMLPVLIGIVAVTLFGYFWLVNPANTAFFEGWRYSTCVPARTGVFLAGVVVIPCACVWSMLLYLWNRIKPARPGAVWRQAGCLWMGAILAIPALGLIAGWSADSRFCMLVRRLCGWAML